MSSEKFTKCFDINWLKGRKTLIVENPGMNVDFLLRDLVRMLEFPSIYIWNNDKLHMKDILANVNVILKSEYDGDVYNSEVIADNIWSAENLFDIKLSSLICIFRDGTDTKLNWYDYDVIINVSPPQGGVSVELDGMVVVRSREEIFCKFLYKVHATHTIYSLI